eukprot:NODE_4259_length_692_cov_315.031397.p1 GENE.NODE_4259_length_692_cov_315.031397~~NODE_4259_length_692_cov_315.031397.p1  ORF type:complete len:134 (-),score=27.95 NODE_4259_length_692_cov_315.031397:274-633(-)
MTAMRGRGSTLSDWYIQGVAPRRTANMLKNTRLLADSLGESDGGDAEADAKADASAADAPKDKAEGDSENDEDDEVGPNLRHEPSLSDWWLGDKKFGAPTWPSAENASTQAFSLCGEGR